MIVSVQPIKKGIMDRVRCVESGNTESERGGEGMNITADLKGPRIVKKFAPVEEIFAGLCSSLFFLRHRPHPSSTKKRNDITGPHMKYPV